MMKKYIENSAEISQLSNGLKIVHLPCSQSVSYAGFFVNAGTRDELPHQWGMAHFAEHMLFKGTAKRGSTQIISRMDRVGGELNAYTQKENTVVYSVFTSEHVARAVDLLCDVTFRSVFPSEELQKEVEVVVDEIHSYDDSPSELIYDEFENILFDSHPLGHFVLGSESHLRTFTSDDVKAFVRHHYTPDQMIFFFMGDTPISRVVRLVEKGMDGINFHPRELIREKPCLREALNVVQTKDTAQSHTIVGGYGYSISHPNRLALQLLCNILGGSAMNSRLNLSLRERRGYVYHVEASHTSYSDTGLFTIYFGGDQHKQARCVNLVHKELKKLREKKLSDTLLRAYKKQYFGQICISRHHQESVALALARGVFYFGKWFSLSEIAQAIDALSPSLLLDVANDLFAPENLFHLHYK